MVGKREILINSMKRTFCILTLVGLVACALVGRAQNNSSEKAPPASANSAATEKAGQPEAVNANTPAAEPVATKQADAKAAQTPAGTASTGTPATKIANGVVVAINEAPPAPTVAANDTAPAPAVASTNGPQPGAVIPLIVMDDVPLTDAIKNL